MRNGVESRLMLEYGRLYADETTPGSNDFTGDE